MTDERMDEVIERRLVLTKHILLGKAKEYVRNNDRLHNFNRAAAISGESRERALKGMWMKHIVSVFDIIDDLDKGIVPKKELVDEKIGDLINYAILLEASINDRINVKEEEISEEK